MKGSCLVTSTMLLWDDHSGAAFHSKHTGSVHTALLKLVGRHLAVTRQLHSALSSKLSEVAPRMPSRCS